MILSVSRRTDIPAFYSDWFYNRIKEGFVYVRNPMSIHNISKVSLDVDIVDCIVFWTKNPKPMIKRLNEINQYNYYFQFSINPYDQNLEVQVPQKKFIIETFKSLSDRIGSNRMIWRYDPIILTQKIDIAYHIKYFESLAKRLNGYTERCVISFVDNYKKTERNLTNTQIKKFSDNDLFLLGKSISEISNFYGIQVQTCAEEVDLLNFGIEHGKCIDEKLIESIIGYSINATKDKNQRKECGCIESVDIGEYNTCIHNCLYCYANFNKEMAMKKNKNHYPKSPLLIGNISDKDIIKERTLKSYKKKDLFD